MYVVCMYVWPFWYNAMSVYANTVTNRHTDMMEADLAHPISISRLQALWLEYHRHNKSLLFFCSYYDIG